MMALLSNHHCNYQNTQSDMKTSTYANSSCTHENALTPQKEVETLDCAKNVVLEDTNIPEGYDLKFYGVLTPVWPQRYKPPHSMDQTRSQSMLYEESSMIYHIPSYCYETPLQKPRYQLLENSKPIITIVESCAKCWESIISTQIIILNNFFLYMLPPRSE